MRLKRIQKDKANAIKDMQDGDTPEPFQSLGVGCVLYRETVYKLICLFALFSIITMPLKGIYEASAGIPAVTETKFARSSLANLGYSTVQCALSPISFEQMSLSCPYGEITSIVDDGMGVNLAEGV